MDRVRKEGSLHDWERGPHGEGLEKKRSAHVPGMTIRVGSKEERIVFVGPKRVTFLQRKGRARPDRGTVQKEWAI